jgi:hypothetical protein
MGGATMLFSSPARGAVASTSSQRTSRVSMKDFGRRLRTTVKGRRSSCPAAFLSMSEGDAHVPTLTYTPTNGAQPLSRSGPSPHQLAALLASSAQGPATDNGGGGFNGGLGDGGNGGGGEGDDDEAWEGEDRQHEIMLYVLVTLCMYGVGTLVAIRSWWKGHDGIATPFHTLTASITAARRHTAQTAKQ